MWTPWLQIGMMVIAKQMKDKKICGALKNCPYMYICHLIILSSTLKTKVVALWQKAIFFVHVCRFRILIYISQVCSICHIALILTWTHRVAVVSSVCPLGHGLDDLGFKSWQCRFFSSQNHPDCLWGPPALLLNGHWVLIGGESG